MDLFYYYGFIYFSLKTKNANIEYILVFNSLYFDLSLTLHGYECFFGLLSKVYYHNNKTGPLIANRIKIIATQI